jgi:hypothetical protein
MMTATTQDIDTTEAGRRTHASLTGRVIPNRAVDRAVADRLYELFAQYYLHVDRATFERDQAEKDWLLLLSDANGTVQGFTTLKYYDLEIRGLPLRAVFSGNTIIDRAHWGEQELVVTWCRFMADLLRTRPAIPLYWFLVCSGYRTYLYLPLFFHEFFPRHDRETPDFERHLIDSLGRLRFPQEYDAGVVRVGQPRECLLPELAVPPPYKLSNPHIRFFAERNPGYLRGDELVCVTEFSLTNTKRLAHQCAEQVLAETAGAV